MTPSEPPGKRFEARVFLPQPHTMRDISYRREGGRFFTRRNNDTREADWVP